MCEIDRLAELLGLTITDDEFEDVLTRIYHFNSLYDALYRTRCRCDGTQYECTCTCECSSCTLRQKLCKCKCLCEGCYNHNHDLDYAVREICMCECFCNGCRDYQCQCKCKEYCQCKWEPNNCKDCHTGLYQSDVLKFLLTYIFNVKDIRTLNKEEALEANSLLKMIAIDSGYYNYVTYKQNGT